MRKKLLLGKGKELYEVKDIAIFESPKKLRAVLSRMGWKILQLLCEREMYPIEIAKKLGVNEQNVYYHIRRLKDAGIINVVREEERKGAVAKYYKVSFPALGVEFPFGQQRIRVTPILGVDEKVKQFFEPFLREDGSFDGKIVVGSPDPHGPFKARARDGHYAAYLTLFLGQFVSMPKDFVIKLDVDIKAEKEEGSNLILVGGPGTNLITGEVNKFLPVRFNMMSTQQGFLLGGLISERTGNTYTADTVGIIARIVNPWNENKRVIVLAGNKAVGTKACVIALTRFWKETLKNFNDEEKFASVIQGFDLDGDGKVDSIEILE